MSNVMPLLGGGSRGFYSKLLFQEVDVDESNGL